MLFLQDFDFSMLYVALGAGAIALIVFLLRKYVPGLSGEDNCDGADHRILVQSACVGGVVRYVPRYGDELRRDGS